MHTTNGLALAPRNLLPAATLTHKSEKPARACSFEQNLPASWSYLLRTACVATQFTDRESRYRSWCSSFSLATFPGSLPLSGRLRMDRMSFRCSCRRCIVPNFRVRMNVRAAVHPGSSPASVVDENRVPTPIKSGKAGAPAPRPEGRSDGRPRSRSESRRPPRNQLVERRKRPLDCNTAQR